MSEQFVAFVLPHIAINLVLIVLFFIAISRRFFSRPHWLLFAGLAFMAIAASEKYLFGLLKPAVSSFADIDPAILFLEVSVAALGGNLVASAFLSKAQVLHTAWKDSRIDILARAQGRLSECNGKLKEHRSLQAQMSKADYIAKLDAILDAIERQEEKIDVIRGELDSDGKL
ncbi:MAG: hypothetical protein WBH09_02850 [Rugosibacter sp.]